MAVAQGVVVVLVVVVVGGCRGISALTAICVPIFEVPRG